MELDEVIRKRRSVRKYNDNPVTKYEIEQMIDAAIQAPSACNFQKWRFIVIDDKKIIDEIQGKGGAEFLKKVRQCIVVFYDNQTDNLEYCDYIESAAAAIENMLLKATEIGVGTCWVNNLPNKRVMRKILSVPSHYDPIAMVSIGHYDKEPNPVKRRFLHNDVISYNNWAVEDKKGKNKVLLLIRRIARKIYKLVPFKKHLYRIASRFEKKFDN